ncbi:MAG: flagellar filament capping protein FliD [Caldimonas sp.]
MATSISTSGTGTISSAGIGSGLDVNSIVTQLMALEQRPLTALQTKATAIQGTVSEYGKIKSAVSTLSDLAIKLANKTTWGQTVATSSNTAVGATTNGATAGTYTVKVASIASVQTLASAAKPAAAPIGAGTLHIELGKWGSAATGAPSFTASGTPPAVDIVVSATDTLADVRDRINGASAGVTATIMTDASGSRLLISSSATGAANGFRTSVVDADGNNTDAAGLSALAYDPTAGASQMTRPLVAADAAATINGLQVTSASNTLANIVDGLTLTLSAPTTAAATVTVVADNDTLKKTLTDFAAAYTSVYKLIAADTRYDPTSKQGGILQGDSAAVGLQNQLRTLAGGLSGASSAFGRLSDVGLQIQTDGSMTVNSTKLDSALANLPEITKLFTGVGGLFPSNDGFGKRFRDTTTAMLGIDGSITSRTTGLSNQLQRNQKDQDSFTMRLAGIEKRLRAQYTALDTQMASLSTQSSYITQQVAAWNNNKN